MDEPQTSLEPQSDPAEGEENAIDTGGETDGSAQVTAKEEEKPKWVTGPVPGESEWSGGYVWSIERFSKLREWKICSAEFDIGTYSWRILVFPFGYSNYCHRDFVSVSVDYPEAEFTPYKICPTAKFEMTAINQEDDKQSVTKGAEHKFTWQAKDWGFAEFLQLEDAVCTSSGFVTNDNFIVTAKLTIFQDPDLYGLVRKETGFVGLKTQDAVSYRNSLLQCLYHLRYVRKLVYQMPVEKMEDRQQSTLFALQRIFYQLQYQNWSVSTRDLVKSFDSEICDPFLKHDIREMQSILCQKIEERMKGTGFEGCASELFIGRYSTYVESKKPKFSDVRETTFTELELDVKGCKNVYEALEKFCQTEQLEGPNNYPAKKLGLKEACRFNRFESFPPVLRLNLKRFRYEPGRSSFIKVTGLFEFYEELNLDHEDYAFHSRHSDKSIDNRYTLHSVLAHGGGVSGGHYFVFVNLDGKWYKFHDNAVTEELPEKAMKEQFGYDENDLSSYSGTGEESSAYMLIYVRNSDWDRVMCGCDKQDLSPSIREQFEAEQVEKEKRRKEKQEAHLYVVITLVYEKQLVEQIGEKHYVGLTNFEDATTYRMHKRTSIEKFKERVYQDFEIEPELQRYWFWSQSDKGTAKIDVALNLNDAALKTVLDFRRVRKIQPSANEKRALMRFQLFVETPEIPDILNSIGINQMILFIKHFDPRLKKLSFVSHLYVNNSAEFEMILREAKERIGLPHTMNVIGFREMDGACTELPLSKMPCELNFADGEIIVVQERLTAEELDEGHYLDAKSFLEGIWNRIEVVCKPTQHRHDSGFQLKLERRMRYSEVVKAIANHLDVDKGQIRLTQHNIYSGRPFKTPLPPNTADNLETILQNTTNILYYEDLGESLVKWEAKKRVSISFFSCSVKLQSVHEFFLPKESTIADVVELLKAELGPEYLDCEIRVMQVRFSKIFKVLDLDTTLDRVNETYWALRAEVVPEEEKDLKLDVCLVHCCHCETYYEAITTFGDPFWIRIKLGETLKDAKDRILEKLEVPWDEVASWKFACRIKHMQVLNHLNDQDEIIPGFLQGQNNSCGNGMYFGDNVLFLAMVHKNSYQARLQYQLDRWNCR